MGRPHAPTQYEMLQLITLPIHRPLLIQIQIRSIYVGIELFTALDFKSGNLNERIRRPSVTVRFTFARLMILLSPETADGNCCTDWLSFNSPRTKRLELEFECIGSQKQRGSNLVRRELEGCKCRSWDYRSRRI